MCEYVYMETYMISYIYMYIYIWVIYMYIYIWCLLRCVLINTRGMGQILLSSNSSSCLEICPWPFLTMILLCRLGWRVVERVMIFWAILTKKVTESDRMEQTQMSWWSAGVFFFCVELTAKIWKADESCEDKAKQKQDQVLGASMACCKEESK